MPSKFNFSNHHNDTKLKKKSSASMRSRFKSVIVIVFHSAEAYSNLDLTKAKYSTTKLSVVKNENVVRINPSNINARENKN